MTGTLKVHQHLICTRFPTPSESAVGSNPMYPFAVSARSTASVPGIESCKHAPPGQILMKFSCRRAAGATTNPLKGSVGPRRRRSRAAQSNHRRGELIVARRASDRASELSFQGRCGRVDA